MYQHQPETITVAVAPETTSQLNKAKELADHLHLPLADLSQTKHHFQLVLTDKRLELRQTGAKAAGPIYVDFTTGAMEYRRKFGGGSKQAIAKAVGIKGGYRPMVLDATAGLGRDAFVLACLGCKVHMFERSPIMHALLEDGMNRAEKDNEIGPIVRERMTLTLGDSTSLLQTLEQEKPEVIYLDPMYPHRTKSALVKKEMRYLRALVGDDKDAPDLLKISLQYARKRVVVKRPKLTPPIEGPEPNLIIKSKNSRYDVYLINR